MWVGDKLSATVSYVKICHVSSSHYDCNRREHKVILASDVISYGSPAIEWNTGCYMDSQRIVITIPDCTCVRHSGTDETLFWDRTWAWDWRREKHAPQVRFPDFPMIDIYKTIHQRGKFLAFVLKIQLSGKEPTPRGLVKIIVQDTNTQQVSDTCHTSSSCIDTTRIVSSALSSFLHPSTSSCSVENDNGVIRYLLQVGATISAFVYAYWWFLEWASILYTAVIIIITATATASDSILAFTGKGWL